MITPRSLLVAVLASALCAAGLVGAPAARAGTSPVRTDAIYQSRGETWIATEDGLLVLDDSGEVVLELPAVTGELAVAGDMVIVLDRGAQGLVLLRGPTEPAGSD